MGYVEDLRKIVGHIPLILVGSVVIITNDENKILLQKRMHHPVGRYGLPGGLMELGESTIETAQREVYEETGLAVRNLNLIDVFSGKENFIKAPNGDEFYVVVTAYWTKEFSGILRINDEESMSLEFINIDELPENIPRSHKEIINRYKTLITGNDS
ncbi:NUDIX hydrolase [Paenibacillus sp. Soil787]|uniref:NUDIX hydrolase n=1 Tax=Paenibacillus sp. Soil787 TaxID=1736411 RepID=UPI0006F5D1D0|nr:NUDIX hydrolase [Paenibacillus sp. Soil787]KRF43765.1 DNA mismatch repair protein MutT [Paenibacillus sp. Soil787]